MSSIPSMNDNFRQLVVTVETAPASLGVLRELEDHCQRSLVRETSLRAYGAAGARRGTGCNGVAPCCVKGLTLPFAGQGTLAQRQFMCRTTAASACAMYDAFRIHRCLSKHYSGDICRRYLTKTPLDKSST